MRAVTPRLQRRFFIPAEDVGLAEFNRQFRRDALGHRLHLVVAILFYFFICWPQAFVEWAGIPLGAYALLRLTNTWATSWRPLLMPLGLFVLASVAWQAISTTWSPDPAHGWNEVSKNRFALAAVVVWPVLDRRPWLVAALALGLIAGNVSQVLNFAGVRWEIEALRRPLAGRNTGWFPDPDRNGGWWHPLLAGSFMVAALGLHLPAALMGRGRARALGLAGCGVSMVGLLATGSRGAMLAGAALLGLCAAVAILRVRPRRAAIRSAGVAMAALLLAGVIGYALVGEGVSRRVGMAVREVTAALRDGDHGSDSGKRVLMIRWTFEALRERPLTGIGAGGFETWTERHGSLGSLDPARAQYFEHAHNSLLHILATTGLIGLVLAAGVVVFAIWGGFRGLTRESLGSYEAGPGFALVGLLFVSMTDPVHFNLQTGALMWALIALCPMWRPRSSAVVPEAAR